MKRILAIIFCIAIIPAVALSQPWTPPWGGGGASIPAGETTVPEPSNNDRLLYSIGLEWVESTLEEAGLAPIAQSTAVGQLLVGDASGGWEVGSNISWNGTVLQVISNNSIIRVGDSGLSNRLDIQNLSGLSTLKSFGGDIHLFASGASIPSLAVGTTEAIVGGILSSDAAPTSYVIQGASAYASATTNIEGGDLTDRAGAGASGTAGAGHGGARNIYGGDGYGTGDGGPVNLYGGTANGTGSDGVVTWPGAFAEIYVADASTAQTIASGASYVKSTAFTTNGEAINATADAANDKITITQAGKYRVSAAISAQGDTAGADLFGAIFVNGTKKDECQFQRNFSTGTDVGSMGLVCIVTAAANDDIDLRFRHDITPGSFDVTISFGNLSVNYLGR